MKLPRNNGISSLKFLCIFMKSYFCVKHEGLLFISSRQVFCQNDVLKHFAKFTGKHLSRKTFRPQPKMLLKIETLTQLFYWELLSLLLAFDSSTIKTQTLQNSFYGCISPVFQWMVFANFIRRPPFFFIIIFNDDFVFFWKHNCEQILMKRHY